MRRESPLPIEFITLAGKVHYVTQKSNNEYCASCPECGGEMHPDGKTYPDRFRMWVVSKYGKPLGWCRRCGYVWTPERERKPTHEEIELWRQEQIKEQLARKAAAELALKHLQSEHLWERFAQATTQYSRQVCHEWGIVDSWIDYLKLGFIPDYTVNNKSSSSYHSPAITFPVWWAGDVVQNIKLRILNPGSDNDRYRNWYRTGEHFFYMPVHDVPLAGGVILVEGEKKAIVAEEHNPTNYRVIGTQSMKPDPELFEKLANCEPIIHIPDPDAFIRSRPGAETGAEYLVRNAGRERSLIVRAPVKLDDGIVKYNMNFSNYLKLAVRPK